MAAFAMCAACAAEYRDPGNRRFHAEPICCADCGPTLRLTGAGGASLTAGAGGVLADAGARLRDGQILAIKGLGGYHLATAAGDEKAVAALRARKHREDKPVAGMVGGLAGARVL